MVISAMTVLLRRLKHRLLLVQPVEVRAWALEEFVEDPTIYDRVASQPVDHNASRNGRRNHQAALTAVDEESSALTFILASIKNNAATPSTMGTAMSNATTQAYL